MNTHKVEEEFQFCNCWTCRALVLDMGRRPEAYVCSMDGTVIGGNFEACSTICNKWQR